MIIVHHLNNSRSQRVLWLLEELGVDYQIKRYQRDAESMMAPPELKAVHPLGKSPVISDGDVVVAESGAIVEYLIAKYGDGRLIPAPNTPQRLRYTYWLHYAEGSLMPPLLMKLIFDRIEATKMPFFVKPVANMITGKVKKTFVMPQIQLHMKYVDAELGGARWFAGDQISGADIQMSFPLEAAMSRATNVSELPNINAFVERIHNRDAYKRALEKGGEYVLGTS